MFQHIKMLSEPRWIFLYLSTVSYTNFCSPLCEYHHAVSMS